MAKLILKVNYYKPGRSKSMGGYAKYIATRENVEKNEDKVLHLKSTDSQQELIEKLLRDFPESIHSEEYRAYCSDGTRENAGEYITRTLEDNIPQIADSPTYADYIATRPRAERIGSHGLFSSGDEPIVLSKVSEELNEHAGNVWVFIASLKREDAARLGYDHASRWKDMIGSQVTKIASAMNIPPEHLKWYAAFHNEGHHPHVHIMVYSTDPREGFINEYGIEKIRSAMARDIREQSREEARPQNEALLSGPHKTARKIAEEHGISRASVERSGEYVKALDIAKEHDPNIERDIMAGEINPSKKDVIHIGKASQEEVPDLVKQLREQKKSPSKKKAGDSIGTISARMAEDKPPATEEDMMVSLQAAVKTLIRTFETTLQYYPEILENPDHRVSLKRIINEIKKYLNKIEGEST